MELRVPRLKASVRGLIVWLRHPACQPLGEDSRSQQEDHEHGHHLSEQPGGIEHDPDLRGGKLEYHDGQQRNWPPSWGSSDQFASSSGT